MLAVQQQLCYSLTIVLSLTLSATKVILEKIAFLTRLIASLFAFAF